MFLTTKLWNDEQGYDAALRAFEASAKRLGRPIDLYLIHWPSPQRGLYLDSWRALVRLQQEGRVGSIGVSNFTVEHLERIIGETGVAPALNQIELHPAFQQAELRAFHAKHGIRTESWSPLGQSWEKGKGKILADPVIAGVAAKHGKTPAQTIIRWHIDSGLIVIPVGFTRRASPRTWTCSTSPWTPRTRPPSQPWTAGGWAPGGQTRLTAVAF